MVGFACSLPLVVAGEFECTLRSEGQVNLKSIFILIAIIGSGCSVDSQPAEAIEFTPLPACEMADYDDCITQRGLNIRPLILRSDSETPLQDAFTFACEQGDAEACFIWAGFLEGERGFLASFPIEIVETIPQDLDQALEFSRKSCELNSIYGCAAVSTALYKSDESFPEEAPETHLEAAMATIKSCQLGNAIGCELVSYFAFFVDGQSWPEGAFSFFTEVAEISEKLCLDGELAECHEQANYLHWASLESGQSDLADRAVSIVRLNCENGYEESCKIVEQLETKP